MGEHKYRAFVSYSHADEKWGDWLHRALETYRAPKALVGAATPFGPAPERLTPIFRDRDDLPAAGSLNAEIQAALSASHFQIVICSPNAARSRWVNEEIKLFKRLHGSDRVLAVIVAGEPMASAIPGRAEEECFPPALRFAVDASGALTDEPEEPVAADARREGDGRRFALLKVAAGLLGVKLDDLIQREASRRARRARLVTGVSMSIAAGFAFLAAAAFSARNDAVRMRGEAEGLIQFMLTGLRDEVETVGRLDALKAVGERALDYYGRQKTRSLDPDALGRRARALMLVGEIDQRRKDLDAALAAYEAAAETTGELLRREPNNQQRIFDHAQSVFYVGDIALARNDLSSAEEGFQEYLRLAEKLVELDPTNPKWRLELAYATSNLGGLKFRAGAYDAAIPFFEQSVAARRALYEAAANDSDVAFAYAYALSWQAYAELTRGAFATAASLIEAQLNVYKKTPAFDRENFKFLDTLVTAQRRLAEAQLGLGDIAGAEAAIAEASQTVNRLIERDAQNAYWKIYASYIEQSISYLDGLRNDSAGELAAAERAVDYARDVARVDVTDADAQNALASALARRVSAGGDARERAKAAEELARLLELIVSAGGARSAALIGEAALALADYERNLGSAEGARRYAAAAVKELKNRPGELTPLAQIFLAGLSLEEGDVDEARRIAAALGAAGVAHPEFRQLQSRLQETLKN